MAVVSSNKFNFAEAVSEYLSKYSAGVTDLLEESIKEVSKESVKKLKNQPTPKRTGKYAKSWTYKPETGRLKVGAVVYSKAPEYRLTHLLEKSHAIRGGGRAISGYTDPEHGKGGRVHIAPVNDWAQEEAIQRFIPKVERYSR